MSRLLQTLRQTRNSTYNWLSEFYKKHKHGYVVIQERAEPKSFFEHVVSGFGIIKTEIKKWLNEQKNYIFIGSNPIFLLHNEVDVIWKFNNSLSCNEWTVTCDSDYNQGFSSASFTQTPGGTAIFSGSLNTQLPKDGKIRKSGYCNVCAPKHRISFLREKPRDWTLYNYLFLRVKGDGRPYMINIGNAGFFDTEMDDLYSYTLYTRGGPYWQDVRLPFSKFVLGNKGKLQDRQYELDRSQVSSFNITVADMANGPFRLEIDCIGIGKDDSYLQGFPYEIYKY